MENVIETYEEIIKTKHTIKGYKIVEEPVFLRHFTAKFEKLA
jgi:tryptophanase